MRLYVLRHTSAAHPHAFDSDRERPLTELGRVEAEQIGRALKRLDYIPDLVLTSPYLRAKETARIVTDTLKHEPPDDCEFLAPGGHPDELMRELTSRPAGSILIVGHAPDVAQIVTAICFADAPSGILFSKGTLAVMDVERPVRRRSGLLHALLPITASEKLAKKSRS